MNTSNKLIKEYHSLNGKTVPREKLVNFSKQLFNSLKENNPKIEEIYFNVASVLIANPKAKKFNLKLKGLVNDMLNGVPFMPGSEIEESDILGKGVTSDDIYNMVTNRIIDYIDENNELTWYNGRNSKKGKDQYVFLPLPLNYTNGKFYRGINTMLLGFYPKKDEKGKVKFLPIEDDRLFWLSFKQIKENNGKLKKGSAANQAIFYNWIYKYNGETITEAKYKQLAAQKVENLTKIPFLRYYSVYNERDITGIDFDKRRAELKKKATIITIETEAEKIDAAEKIINNMPLKPQIIEKHIGEGESPMYMPMSDKVIMPLKTQYDNVAIWYGTAFHELTHSTGHEKRVGRIGVTEFDRFGSPQYAFEELVAELGSAFLNSESGIFFHTIKKNSAYIKGWARSVKKMLKENNKAIFIAAGQAQKAADYILDRDSKGVPKYLQGVTNTPAKSKKTPLSVIKITKSDIKSHLKQQSKEVFANNYAYIFSADLDKVLFRIEDKKTFNEYVDLLTDKVFKNQIYLKEIQFKTKPGKKTETIPGPVKTKNKTTPAKTIIKPIKNETDLLAHTQKIIDLKLKRNRSKSTANKAKLQVQIDLLEKIKQEFEKTMKPKVKKLPTKKRQPKIKVNPTTGQTALFGAKKKINSNVIAGASNLIKGSNNDVPQSQLFNNLKPVSNRVQQSEASFYNITGDIATFLGAIEIKPIHSVAITLDAPQGAGKTRTFFQFINEFSKNYKCLFVSAEEHPQSVLFQQKLDQYVAIENQNNVYAVDTTNFNEIKELIPHFEVIFIDSWNKIAEQNKGVDFDTDLRKGFNGKLFFNIFQRTTNGTMRGGSKAQFDGDVILKMFKGEDYKDSYIFADKNRYQTIPLNELKYYTYHQKIIADFEQVEEPGMNQPDFNDKVVIEV